MLFPTSVLRVPWIWVLIVAVSGHFASGNETFYFFIKVILY